jgi:hypothetical protein
VINNLVHGKIQFAGGEALLGDNQANRLDGYFVDAATGNLALTAAATSAIDQGRPLPDVTHDIRHRPRDARPDRGAWEYATE